MSLLTLPERLLGCQVWKLLLENWEVDLLHDKIFLTNFLSTISTVIKTKIHSESIIIYIYHTKFNNFKKLLKLKIKIEKLKLLNNG